jgi:hypothetical protein
MQITTFDLVMGLAGLISLGFNFFQLYQDRIKSQKLEDQRKLHEATLLGIWQNLTKGANSLLQLEHKGADATTIATNMARVVDSQRIQIAELLEGYYGVKVGPRDSFDALLKTSGKGSSNGGIELIDGVEAITSAMLKAVEDAEKYVFTIGGRSRNDPYLNALKQRVHRGDVRYIRIITGDHVRHPLCQHIRDMQDQIELGHLPEDKYGGVLVTHETVILALQSSRVPSLDKGLRIQNERIASDYRLYVLELLSSSNRAVDAELIQSLCTTCRQKRSNISSNS